MGSISSASVRTSYVDAVGHHVAVAEHDRPGAQLQRVGQVVGDHQHGHVQRPHDVGELPARRRVEVGRRLVEHQDLRLHRQHGGDRDPAPLAEGEVVRRPVDELGHADHAPARSSPGRRARAPEIPRLVGPNATSARTEPMNSWSSGSWKTMPTRRRISARFGFSTGQSADLTVPAPAWRMPLRCSTSVVLPAPLGPSRATRSPGGRAGRRRTAPGGRRGRRTPARGRRAPDAHRIVPS